MSSDPHAPTPAGPDPDAVLEPDQEATEVHAAVVPEAGADVVTEPEPTPAVAPADADAEHPAGTVAPERDWLTDPAPAAVPGSGMPSAVTPPAAEQDGGPAAQAAEIAQRPEVQVGLAFLGGAVLTLVLKRFRR